MKARSNNLFLCPEKIRKGKRNKLIEFLNKKMSKHACCKRKKKTRNRRSTGWRRSRRRRVRKP